MVRRMCLAVTVAVNKKISVTEQTCYRCVRT